MEVKTWEQLAIWLCMQFPVAGFCFGCVWYTVRWADRRHEQAQRRADEERERLLAERDKMIALLNETIQKLTVERNRLMELRYPSWGKGSEGGGTNS